MKAAILILSLLICMTAQAGLLDFFSGKKKQESQSEANNGVAATERIDLKLNQRPEFSNEERGKFAITESDWDKSIVDNLACNPENRPAQFNFCPDSNEINFVNAYWLSCLAANQYGPFSVINKDLTKNLGFISKSDAEFEADINDLMLMYRRVKLEQPALYRFIQLNEEQRSKTKLKDIPQGYNEFMSQRSFMMDRLVHYKVPFYLKDKRAIDFYSTNSSDAKKTLGKDEVIDMLAANGMKFLKRFSKVSDQELDKKYDSVKIGGTQVLWAEQDDFIVISVRGTEPPKNPKSMKEYTDIVTDLMAFQVMFDIETKKPKKQAYTSFLHIGFNAAFAQVMEKFLTRKLQNLRAKSRKLGKMPKPIFVTGHSLGGAVASLIGSRILFDNFKEWIDSNHKTIDGKPTMENYIKRLSNSHSYELTEKLSENAFCENLLPTGDLAKDYVPKSPEALKSYYQEKAKNNINHSYIPLKGVYTFGSPRVGDGTFKKIVECMAKRSGTVFARFRNNNDIVPTVPHYNNYAVVPYTHIGTPIVLSSQNPGGQRAPYMEINEEVELESQSKVIRPLTQFYANFAKGNYVESSRGLCEPGTHCWAHNNPFYYIFRNENPAKIPSEVSSYIKLGLNVKKNFAYIKSAGLDHKMATIGSKEDEQTNDYVQSLRSVYPTKFAGTTCKSYDVKASERTVHDVIWSMETRQDRISTMANEVEKMLAKKNGPSLVKFKNRLNNLLLKSNSTGF